MLLIKNFQHYLKSMCQLLRYTIVIYNNSDEIMLDDIFAAFNSRKSFLYIKK